MKFHKIRLHPQEGFHPIVHCIESCWNRNSLDGPFCNLKMKKRELNKSLGGHFDQNVIPKYCTYQ